MQLPNNFDLRSLQVFVVTAEQGGMTQSARFLGMTQSAVSQIIASLEEAIGTRLFDRSVRPIVLTATGGILLRKGRQILNDSLDAYREASTLDQRKFAVVTIAMPDSLAGLVSSPLLRNMNDVSTYWRIWSGMSPYHRDEFLSHAIDLLFTSSDAFDDVAGLRRDPIISEPFVMIFPKDYVGPTALTSELNNLGLMRFSMRSAMGRRIETQFNRLRLSFPERAEFDSASGHVMAVANGLGWGITSPLCLLQRPSLIDQVKIVPITPGQFHREFVLVSREGSMGELPKRIARETQDILRSEYLPILYANFPWLEKLISWGDRDQE